MPLRYGINWRVVVDRWSQVADAAHWLGGPDRLVVDRHTRLEAARLGQAGPGTQHVAVLDQRTTVLRRVGLECPAHPPGLLVLGTARPDGELGPDGAGAAVQAGERPSAGRPRHRR